MRRWWPIPHSGLQRSAYILRTNERLRLGDRHLVGPDSRLLLRYGAGRQEADAGSATLAIELADTRGKSLLLAELPVPAGSDGRLPREALIDLGPWAGQEVSLHLRIDAANDKWVALFETVLAAVDGLDRVRARAFHEERARNELAHFQHVYGHAVYAGTTPSPTPSQRRITCLSLDRWVEATEHIDSVQPAPMFPSPAELPYANSDAFHYAHALLTRELKAIPPDFPARMRAMQREGPLRILSLCSGAARIEAGFAATPGIDAEWTLLDISEDLLQDAAKAFPGDAPLQLVVGNLNQIRDFGQRFDVILCVSGLHHIVELERVVDFIHAALAPGGEFWSIGEAIGRNGNQLWPEDYAVANGFFRSLPEHLRINRASGEVDRDLPTTDYSNASFEGIRSEDIEALLCRRLEPIHLYRRNCFLWRIVDLAYAGNYDLASDQDVAWLQRAVGAELARFRAGGRATELHAVYRRSAD